MAAELSATAALEAAYASASMPRRLQSAAFANFCEGVRSDAFQDLAASGGSCDLVTTPQVGLCDRLAFDAPACARVCESKYISNARGGDSNVLRRCQWYEGYCRLGALVNCSEVLDVSAIVRRLADAGDETESDAVEEPEPAVDPTEGDADDGDDGEGDGDETPAEATADLEVEAAHAKAATAGLDAAQGGEDGEDGADLSAEEAAALEAEADARAVKAGPSVPPSPPPRVIELPCVPRCEPKEQTCKPDDWHCPRLQ